MPPGQQSPEEKLKKSVKALKSLGWRSTNEFVEQFYNNEDMAAQSLRFREDSSYAPEAILTAWLARVPSEAARAELKMAITRKAATIMVDESTKAYHHADLRLSTSDLELAYDTPDFGLQKLQDLYLSLLPCLSYLLHALLTAQNDYERWNKHEKIGKDDMALKVLVMIISVLLFFRNRATNAFQIIMGIFLASSGASRRIIDTLNHMGLSVSYQTVQSSLCTLTQQAKKQARSFVRLPNRLWAVVYDNINFTLRTTSQRIDSATQQINATTVAVFSLPKRFSKEVYQSALSIMERKRRNGLRRNLTKESLIPTEEKQAHVTAAFKHALHTILLTRLPGQMRKKKATRSLRKHTKKLKPKIRLLGHEKTEFFPLPALNEEESSVGGTIKVIEKIYTSLLGLAVELIEVELKFTVGDWLTIRNIRLLKDERADEFSPFLRFDWIQEAAMPFHFQLNAMYMLFRTHLGTAAQENPSSLEHHRNLLRRSKLDPKKPEYNKAKELLNHSLIARILDCTRIVLKKKHVSDLKTWKPDIPEFESVINEVLTKYATTTAAHDALEAGDEVLAHSILFIRDSLFFWEFCDAVRDADVGRMWVVYDFWLFMMRGAGCHNYGNELLEMKALFEHEFPALLREVVERTWLVNRWGKKGRSIPTDLYLEHNNNFTKARQNMFAAMGSAASISYIQEKSSACVEILRKLAHDVTSWFSVRDPNRQHSEVSINADIAALCLDISVQRIHIFTRGRTVSTSTTGKNSRSQKQSAVKDVLLEGMSMLTEKDMFDQWMKRTEVDGSDSDNLGGDADLDVEGAFVDPNGRMEVDSGLDEEFARAYSCPNTDLGGDSDN